MRISLIIFLGLFSSSMSFAQQLPFPTPTPTNQSMSPQTSSKGVSANFFIAKATLNAALDPTSCTTSGVGIVNTPGASYSFPDVGAPGTYWGQYSGGYFTNNCLNVVPGDPLANVDGCNFTFLCLVRVEPGPGIVEFNSLQYSYSNGYSPNSMPPSWFTIPTSPAGDPPSLWSFAPNSIVISSDGDTISSADGVPFTIDGYPLTTATSYCATCGDPVSLATGAFWHEMTDFSVKGRTAATTLALKRTYISQPLIPFGDFGANWFSSYETKILAVNPTANTNLVWIDENGGAWTFTRNSDNSFTSPPAFFGKLVEFSDHWEIQKTHGIINSYTRSAGVAPVGSLIQISEPHGEKITFAYNSNGKLTSAYTPLAGEVDFARDSSGRVTTVTRVRDSLSYSYAYDSSGELISSTDFNYQTTYYGYYRPSALVGSLLTYIFDPIGRLYQQSFDSIGRVIFQTEPGGASRTFTYTSQFKNPTTVVNDIDGSTTTYGFDSYYRTVSENHSSDNSTRSYAWSNQNQLTSITDELGFITQYGYDSRGNLTSIQKPEDKKPLSFSYDQKFDVVNAITPLTGTLLQLTINQSNGDTNLVTRGNLSLSYSYDSFGNKLVTNNGLASYADQRNSNGLLTYVYDAHNPATLSYDSRGRVISIFSKSGRVIKITYNDYDKITSINDSAGSITNFLYDPVNRVIEKQVADGKTTQTTSYTWDARDRLTKVTDPLQNTNQIQYDYIDPNSNLKYITSGPTSIVDAANNTTKFQYDARDRLIEKVDASGGASKFSYNLRGDQVSITDQDSNVTTFSFDGNSRISQRIRPSVVTDAKGNSSKATQVTNFTYDPAGHILKEQNLSVSSIDKGKAFVTEYTYDSQDRLAEKKLSTQMNSVLISVDDDSTYSYQPQLDKIRLTSANNQLEQLTFSYEVTPPFLNAKYGVKATDPKNSLGLLQGNYSISRDVTGNIAALTDANGHELFSEISDSAGRLLELTSGNYFGKQSKPFSAQIGYDGYGRKVNIAFSSGLQGTTTFDVLNRPTSIIWNQNKAQQFTESLQYDAVGNMITEDRETGSISMKYDVNHQLTAVTGGLSEKSSNAGIVGLVEAFLGKTASQKVSLNYNYTYDLAGNRISESARGNSEIVSNFLTSDSESVFSADPDGLGRVVQEVDNKTKNTKKYTYRGDGKLTGFSQSVDLFHDCLFDSRDATVGSAKYYYDALGRRVAKQIGYFKFLNHSQSYIHLADEDKILIASDLQNPSSATVYFDGHGLDEHLGYMNSRHSFAYATDHLGSVINGIAAGNFHMFTPFGETVKIGNNVEDRYQDVFNLFSNVTFLTDEDPVRYGFAGRALDDESGKYYFRSRTYQQETGRFLTKDSIGFRSGDLNLYRYVTNNPLRFTDPTGTCAFVTQNFSPAGQAVIGAVEIFLGYQLAKNGSLLGVGTGLALIFDAYDNFKGPLNALQSDLQSYIDSSSFTDIINSFNSDLDTADNGGSGSDGSGDSGYDSGGGDDGSGGGEVA